MRNPLVDPQPGDERGACQWTQSGSFDFDDVWDTECGQTFQFTEGKPHEGGIDFCCYCGKRIVVETALKEADDG